MDELELLLSHLDQDLLRKDVRMMFSGLTPGFMPTVGARTVMAGNLLSFCNDWLEIEALWYVPGIGFQPHEDKQDFRIYMDGVCARHIHLARGIQLVCTGERVLSTDSAAISLRNARICFRPEVALSMPWDAVHMFSGAFGGWHQALNWLDKQGQSICVGQEIFLDQDPRVMEVWSLKFGTPFQHLQGTKNIAWTPAKAAGYCGSVSDFTIVDLCRTQVNLLGTISPPCQSWSKGGKRGGLQDQNGFAFLEALSLAFSLQMVALAAECADDIVSHHHFKIVKALAHALGYRLVWDQVTPFHPIAAHARSRWLGVWIRADAATQLLPFQLKLPNIPQSHWTDQACHFVLPDRWTSQLKLSPSECAVYDSVRFLPPAKRPRYENKNLQNKEVIRSRVPDPSEILPTLCASYSRQHLLAEGHLEQKGIFACLNETSEGFCFFDPAMYCSLFGATESVILSEKIGESFLFVGNAITVPHSILALSIVLHATSACQVDPIGLVRKAWSDRLTARNAVLFAHDGFVHMVPVSSFWEWVKISDAALSESSKCTWNLTGTCAGRQFSFQVSPQQTIRDAFRASLDGPSALLHQINGRNEDIKILHLSTLEQIANQERSFRLVLGHATVGECKINPVNCTAAQTKVIEDPSDGRLQDAHIPFTLHDFDTQATSDVFWAIQSVVETLQDDENGREASASVIVLPENIGLTTLVPSVERVATLQQVANLPIFRHRNKRFISIPGEMNAYLLISDKCDTLDSSSVEVILRFGEQFVGGARIPSQVKQIYSQLFCTGSHLQLRAVNGHPAPRDQLRFQNGDSLDMCHKNVTRAGGHHLNLTAPPALPAFADFTARVEFLCDTHGWVATDEMFHYTQALQWQQDWLRFGTPQLWDVTKGDFEDPVFGELQILNNTTTAIPVLIGSHWAGVEIYRNGSDTQVTFIQVPAEVQTALTFLVARLLDIAPHRFHVRTEANHPSPHICGWNLLFRWYRRHGIHQGIADISTHFTLSAEYNDLIQIAMQCSCEDWALAQISVEIGQLAFTLRKNFLCYLARRESQGRPCQQIALHTACPPISPQPHVPAAPQQVPFVPLHVRVDRTQAILDRIRHRLVEILQHPGWMSSDELDIALEGPRAMNPQTLFCPPSTWNIGASHLHFFNDYIPDYRAYNQVIWIIEVNRHWVQAEAYLHEDSSNFAFTFPADSHILLQPLVDHLLNITGARNTQISIHFYDQICPQHLCGYQLVANIYHRLAANTVPLQPPQRRQLSFHPLAAEFDRAHHEAREAWTTAAADPHLIEFAANIRQWFLIRIAENRFPIETTSAGAKEHDDVTMQSEEAAKAKPSPKPAPSAPADGKDPWLKSDPWLKATPRPAQCRWEDLLIRDPTPFTGTDGTPLPQNHRLQIGGARGGIVFATKAHVQDIIKCAGNNDLAILMPANDNVPLAQPSSKIEGPFEVSVDDTSAKVSYKRLVMMYVVRGSIQYKLPTPIAKLTTGAVCEIVLEIDSRLIMKSELDRYRENPIASFKMLLGDVVPKLDSSAVIFGFRIAHHPGGTKQDPLLQCVLKAPHAVRTPLIEASGMTHLLTRDFLEKGRNSDDLTVLPRFWPPTIADLANTRKTVEGTEGLAGLVLTRRGIAPRVWVSKVGKARAQLMSEDPRVLPENIDVVPKFTFSLAGWPAATGANHVVTSTLQALRLPVLPLRTYRSAGVHVWIVTTDQKPTVSSFPLQINDTVVEILIQQVENSQQKSIKPGGKGGSKGKSKDSGSSDPIKPWNPPSAIIPVSAKPDEARIQRLEERFDKIEARQTTFETRVDGKFDSIQDALRQILANTNSRAREPTGETPPSKHSKQC